MSFTPTPEQQACVSAATSSTSNLLVSALAGAAKTSTLVLMAEALHGESILCLAFNKKIAEEMKERLPTWCTSQTLNSLGYRAWSAFLRRRLTVESRKTFFFVKDWIKENIPADEVQDFYDDEYQDVMEAISAAKTCGYIPDEYSSATPTKPLMGDDEFFHWLDWTPSEDAQRCIIECLVKSIEEAFQGRVDYDDMIYLSTLFNSCTFPQFPIIMIDEAQDLSAINHAMLVKLARGKSRLIAVGDECQAIYGFRGAHEDSMALLKKRFEMEELRLSISFRCPQAVVKEARWRAPHMQYPEWAVEGSINHLGRWTIDDIPERAAIICRNNAPLYRTAFRLLRNGRYPEIFGGGLTKRLTKIFESFGSPYMPIDEVTLACEMWREQQLLKRKDAGPVNDMYECLLIFTAGAVNLSEVLKKVKDLEAAAGPIKLMTGHKSKGLEFPHVFILDQDLLAPRGQDRNLKYVMQTRAQETLTYIASDGFVEGLKEKEVG